MKFRRCSWPTNELKHASDTDPILSSDFSGRDVEKDEEFQSYYQYFYEELEMDYLFREFPYDKEVLESILEILVETVCSKRKLIRVASDDKPAEVVRSRLMKLNSEHIRYVLGSPVPGLAYGCLFIFRMVLHFQPF